MKFKVKFFPFFLLLVTVTSCTSYKKVPYFQLKERDQGKSEVDISTYYKDNAIRFQPDDVLGITINIVGASSVAYDYNLPLQPIATSDNTSEESANGGYGRQTYLIDREGQIDFPVLGLIRVSGYTQAELQKHIKKLVMAKYLKVEPIVTVRLLNFRLTVIGEVNRSGIVGTTKDHITLLEALALAGDMTIYGKRDGIVLLREMPDGVMKRIVLDISKADIISSPYFYLRQGDMIYVAPNKARAQQTDVNPQTGTILGIGSFLISVVSFILLLTR